MRVAIGDTCVTVDSLTIDMPAPPREALVIGDVAVIRLDVSSAACGVDSVIAVSANGRIAWRFCLEGVNAIVAEGGLVRASNACGQAIRIAASSGKAVSSEVLFSIEGETIGLSNGSTVKLENTVLDCIAFESVIVALIKYEVEGGILYDNVVGISFDGRLLWRIAQSPGKPGSYTAIRKDGGYLWAYSWFGVEMRIEPLTGRMVGSRFTK